jgi:hypothetical protein
MRRWPRNDLFTALVVLKKGVRKARPILCVPIGRGNVIHCNLRCVDVLRSLDRRQFFNDMDSMDGFTDVPTPII